MHNTVETPYRTHTIGGRPWILLRPSPQCTTPLPHHDTAQNQGLLPLPTAGRSTSLARGSPALRSSRTCGVESKRGDEQRCKEYPCLQHIR